VTLTVVAADQALRQLDAFDTIIDARSEDEHQLDRLPGAVNWPTLNNAERQEVGTVYKQVSAFEARKRGAAMAASNIGRHIAHRVLDKPRDWTPLVYCWRGGKRSGALALVLDQIGFRVTLLEGGYKAFRAAMLADLDRLAGALDLRVVCGTTGSGKTRLLHALAQCGAQVVDLEALACHRSSVLGAVPGQVQPSQKRFDTLIWEVLRLLDHSHPVFVESESRKVGNVAVPVSLMNAMRSATCINLVLPDTQRVALLMEDYANFVQEPDAFCARLEILTQMRGKALVQAWKTKVRNGDFEAVVMELLTSHYDPVYLQSMRRNFLHFEQARIVKPLDRSLGAMQQLASRLGTAATGADG